MKTNAEYVAERRRELKKLIVEYMGGKCHRCGWNEHQCSLVPHHVDATQKEFSLSRSGKTLKWETLKKECDKCILLCMNCHGVIHTKYEEYYFNLENIPSYSPVVDHRAIKRRAQRHCADCDIEIGFYSYRCKPCAGRYNGAKRYKIDWPSMSELESLVREFGFSETSKKLGVSDNAIRKHLRSKVADVG